MKKYIYLACVILVFQVVFAQDLSPWGMTIIGSDGKDHYEVEDKGGYRFYLSWENEQALKSGLEIAELPVREILKWSNLSIEKLTVDLEDNRVGVNIVPASYVNNDLDMARYMPSGMQFYISEYTEYDFRMFKDSIFLRMKGQLFSEEQFSEKLYKALDDPVLYIRTTDPEYVFRKFDNLDSVLEANSAGIIELNEKLNKKLDKINSELVLELEEVRKQMFKLAEGSTALLNSGFMWKGRALEEKAAEYILKWKAENPALTIAEGTSLLSGEGLKLSKWEIKILFYLYFNDYSE